MPNVTTKLMFAVFAASAGSSISGAVYAVGAVSLVDSQLDGVTAGGAGAMVSANGQAVGLYIQGSTNSLALASGEGKPDSPWNGSVSLASGVVGVQASNVVSPGQVSTAVQTDATVSGNFVYKYSLNQTVRAAGAAVQVGYTYASGALIPGVF